MESENETERRKAICENNEKEKKRSNDAMDDDVLCVQCCFFIHFDFLCCWSLPDDVDDIKEENFSFNNQKRERLHFYSALKMFSIMLSGAAKSLQFFLHPSLVR